MIASLLHNYFQRVYFRGSDMMFFEIPENSKTFENYLLARVRHVQAGPKLEQKRFVTVPRLFNLTSNLNLIVTLLEHARHLVI